MSPKSIKYHPEVSKLEHEDTTAPETKRVLMYGWDSDNLAKTRIATDSSGNILMGGLVPKSYDYIALTYVSGGNGSGEIETVTYKTGGASGTTVATLTLAYNASNEISSVTKS